MNESKEPKDPKASKAPKGTKGTKGSGPHRLRILSPLPPDLDQLVYDVIGAGMRVHSALGPGLLESTYTEAFVIELERQGIAYQREVPVQIEYEGRPVKRGRLDLVVENQVIVELKTVSQLHSVHSSQMLTYLRATKYPLG